MRIILSTGKGGVGKTTVAACTALCAADHGYRTIVLSTDPAHSLGDAFDQTLGPEPVHIASGLWAQEVDVYHEIEQHWGTIQRWLAAFMQWGGIEEVVAEELTVLPGMEELASLLQIVRHYESGRYDVIVVDCAPTGETLRLLSFPEVMRWYLDKIFPVQRRAAKVLRPAVRSFIDVPLPGDEVFTSVESMFRELEKMRVLLSDPKLATVRLVLNPEKMVIKEAQRSYTYLSLFGYATDAVICNRLLPDAVHDVYFDAWKQAQARYAALVEESFAPLPVLSIPLFDREVVGPAMLRLMAQSLFGSDDPTRIYHRGQTQRIASSGDGYALTLPLPFVDKGDMEVLRSADELIIHVAGQRRTMSLPRVLARLHIAGARLEGGILRVLFRPAEQAPVAPPGRAPRRG